MRKPLLAIFIALIPFLSSSAQTKQYQFQRIDIMQGLSHTQVSNILRDSTGFMWFGTLSGLNRYDGYQFKVFKNRLKDSSSISESYIERIFPSAVDAAFDNVRILRIR